MTAYKARRDFAAKDEFLLTLPHLGILLCPEEIICMLNNAFPSLECGRKDEKDESHRGGEVVAEERG